MTHNMYDYYFASLATSERAGVLRVRHYQPNYTSTWINGGFNKPTNNVQIEEKVATGSSSGTPDFFHGTWSSRPV